MHKKIEKINTSNGFVEGALIVFDKQDRKQLKNIYSEWASLNRSLRQIGGRRPAVPPELVEGIVCLECNMCKVEDDIKFKYDLWDPNEKEGKNRVELKYATNSIYRIMIPISDETHFDKLVFVKLLIDDGEELRYEIYEYEYSELIQMAQKKGRLDNISSRNTLSRLMIDYKEMKLMNSTYVKAGTL